VGVFAADDLAVTEKVMLLPADSACCTRGRVFEGRADAFGIYLFYEIL
jgi:hypothetical protein